MHHMHRRLSQSGVSEVVGTILILVMTVVLFSSIIVWVANIPTPQATTRLDMDGQLTPVLNIAGNWIGANTTIRHRGGESLYGYRTQVFFTVERNGKFTTEILKTKGTIAGVPYGLEGPDANWNTGERWSYTNYSVLSTDRVTVTIVDKDRSLILWNEPIQGTVGDHPPLFVEKWADRLPLTPSIDVPWTGRTFGIFTRVTDQDGDLNKKSVYVYLAFLFGTPQQKPPLRMYDDGTNGDQRANDGVFSLVTTSFVPDLSWDGGIVLLNATDLRHHATTSRMTLRVEEGLPLPLSNGFTGTWNATLGGIGQGDSGPEGDYGYNIFNKTGLPAGNNSAGTPTRFFKPGEKVFVIARSTVIRNLENINTFILRNETGFKLFPPTKEFDSRDPTKTTPAFSQTLLSPWFEYLYSFTAPMTTSSYPLEFTLKDNAGHAPFFATDRIWVTATGLPPAVGPKLVTYRDPNKDGVLNDLVPTTMFKSTERIYVRIFFKDLDLDTGACTPWFSSSKCPVYVNANAGDIEMQDYYGSFPVKKKPGNSPVSKIATFDYDQPGEKTYVFYIDLLHRNQDPWVPGTNFYTLRLRSIADSGFGGTTSESYQMLATQVSVIAPLSTIDIVEATQGSATNAKNRGIYWYRNSFYWVERAIDILPNDAKKPTALTTGDLNGDTKIDVVIALDSKEITNIVAYYNLDYGTTWRRDFVNQVSKRDDLRAESLAIADLDGDGDGEIVAGIRDENSFGVGVYIFWNDGSWSTQLLDYSEGGVKPNMRNVEVADINNDGRPDIVSSDSNGVTDYYCNNVRGSWLPGDLTPCPGKTKLEAPGTVLPAGESILKGVKVDDLSTSPQFNSLSIGELEGVAADLNPTAPGADTTQDIVTSNGKDLVIYRTKVTNGVPSWTKFNLDSSHYTGDANTKTIRSIAIGDMNNDGMIDIVFGIDPPNEQSGVYRLRNKGMTGTPPNFANWESILLPHTIINPKDNKIANLDKVTDIALGDTDGDGDLDIVWVSALEDDKGFLNNLWFYENVGDDKTTYVEQNLFTDGWFKRREVAFGVELNFIDL